MKKTKILGDKIKSKRRLFTPFERNKIRWGLACYRWKEGVSWNDYHLDIRHALNLGLNDKRITEGKDPKRFVVENIQPKEEKLALYKEFLEKVASEYINFKDNFEFFSVASDYFGGLSGISRLSEAQSSRLVDLVFELEKHVYIKIHSDDVFGSRAADVICFRKISESPKVIVYRFSVDFIYEIKVSKNELHGNDYFAEKESDLFGSFISNISIPAKLDDYPLSNLSIGFAIPIADDHFIGVDTNQEYHTQNIFFNTSGRWNDNPRITKVDQSITVGVFSAIERQTILFGTYKAFEIPAIQEKIAKMGFIVL